MAEDKRFTYEDYERNILATREELTGMSKLLLAPSTSVFSVIVTAIKVAAIRWLFEIRRNMFEEEMAIGKQIYERRRKETGRDDLDDPLDGKKDA